MHAQRAFEVGRIIDAVEIELFDERVVWQRKTSSIRRIVAGGEFDAGPDRIVLEGRLWRTGPFGHWPGTRREGEREVDRHAGVSQTWPLASQGVGGEGRQRTGRDELEVPDVAPLWGDENDDARRGLELEGS